MSSRIIVETLTAVMQANRGRTLATLDQIEKNSDGEVLGWRPGPGRAHLAWQFMHIAITEDIFATERLNPEQSPVCPTLWSRFRGGSVPDEDIPNIAQVRETLSQTRSGLISTLEMFSDERLSEIPESLKARGWTVRDALHVINWHECHHQGQAHITYNLYRNRDNKPSNAA
jgi:hypothetical protein